MDFEKTFSDENKRFVLKTLDKLEHDIHKPAIVQLIDNGVVNIWLVLAYLAKLLKVERYLEVGVRRGFSMAIVAARRPKANLVGFDKWITDYANAPNPGPDFVRGELQRLGHIGVIEFVQGDTAETLPSYHPTELFPLILVDGDHTEAGAYRDISACLNFLAPGGYLVVDDLQDPAVMTAWTRITGESVYMESWQDGRVGVMFRTQPKL